MMKLKICLFILFCLQSKFISGLEQNVSNSDLQFSFEPRSTQVELAEARKNKNLQFKILSMTSLPVSKIAEIETAQKNITQAVFNETSSDQDQKASTNLNVTAGFDPSLFSQKAPKSGVSQTFEAMRLKAKFPKTEMKS